MASRRRAREYALQALYDSDLSTAEEGPSLESLWQALLDDEGLEDCRPAEEEEMAFAGQLVQGVITHRDEIDPHIESCSTNWRLVRMPIVDRNILRLAGFELIYCPEIPATVTINEAIELAKRFGGADSRAFVNGIVDSMARRLKRIPERRPPRSSKRRSTS